MYIYSIDSATEFVLARSYLQNYSHTQTFSTLCHIKTTNFDQLYPDFVPKTNVKQCTVMKWKEMDIGLDFSFKYFSYL